jgi:hypothetical protein
MEIRRPGPILVVWIATVVLLGLAVIASRAGAKSVRVSVRDLPENGLRLVAPTDPSFDQELVRLGINTPTGKGQSVDDMRAFFAVLENKSSQDVVAYRLIWEIVKADGTVSKQTMTYAEPSALMGRDPDSMSPELRSAGFSIGAKSSRFVSAIPLKTQQSMGMVAGGGGGFGGGSKSEMNIARGESSKTATMDMLQRELLKSQSLTVNLDAAVFDDGTFVGPDSSNYFRELEAEITAKNDLLREVLKAAKLTDWTRLLAGSQQWPKEAQSALMIA